MRTIDRRRFIGLAGAAGITAALGSARAATSRAGGRWSDPSTWGGRVPGRRDFVRITNRVVLDTDARVAGVVVEKGGSLVFRPAASCTLRSTGNVVVRGGMEMKPRGPSILHRIAFVDVAEQRIAGGGHSVLKTDVGLWVMHGGRLDLSGTPKLAWARAAGALEVGSNTVALDRSPEGWRVGDEVVIAPTAAPGSADHRSFHRARIASVSGSVVTLDRPLGEDHPVVVSEAGRTFTAEVLNLTRNVRVEGRPGGRAHVFVRAHRPQTIRHTTLRHVGPRHRSGSFSKAVLGRYGLHFHHSYEGSRGSVVEGVVVRDCGNHCFVPHTSHGISFKNCIAYNALESPFWWDEGDVTNGVTWEDSVAARVEVEDPTAAHDLTGFFLGKGTGNVTRGCTAVGIGGRLTASGFQWPPEPANAVWTFEDSIAHNNAANGIFVWQRIPDNNLIDRFVAFHNNKAGLEHGSFSNAFVYSESLLLDNGEAQVILHANSAVNADSSLSFSSVQMEGGPVGLDVVEHAVPTPDPVRFVECAYKNNTLAAVRLSEGGGEAPGKQDFVRCTVGPAERDLEPSDFLVDFMEPATQVRVQRRDGTAFKLENDGRAVPIEPFDA
jgi:hypothetical protein